MITAKYYHDDAIFEKEKKFLVKDVWLLVAHSSELIRHNDFLTYDYLNHRFFLQRFRDEVKAFENICLHRFNTIHPDAFGNRPANCVYHNWNYDIEGKPSHLQGKSNFLDEQISGLKLKEYAVEQCGEFIFIKLDSQSSKTLQSYLGDLFDSLKELSFHFGGKTTDYYLPHACNWKIILENVLECYHCKSVHADSFAKMGYGYKFPVDMITHKEHSYCNFPKKDNVEIPKSLSKVLANRSLKAEGYKHFYIYPNVFISTVEGMSLYMGFMNPENAVSTMLRVRNFQPTFSEGKTPLQNITDFLNESGNNSLHTVLNEDKAIVEQIQKNVKIAADKVPVWGEEETRIKNFYQYYQAYFNQ